MNEGTTTLADRALLSNQFYWDQIPIVLADPSCL
jgi:hypothetical protein